MFVDRRPRRSARNASSASRGYSARRLDNLNRFIVPSVAGPARLVPLTALVSEEFSVAALRQAAQRGRLDAIQGSDGVWRSSQLALQAYRRSKHQRRPGGRTSD
jgi:hypothetical protein